MIIFKVILRVSFGFINRGASPKYPENGFIMNNRLKSIIALLVTPVLLINVLMGCSKDPGTPEWEWEDEEKVLNANKPKYIWIDAAANFPDFANNKENITRDLTIAKNSGFTHVIVDVRPTTGDVLFNTNVVDQEIGRAHV